jgi:hypothetical protein
MVAVTNRSDRPLLLPKTDSALDSDSGHLWNNVVKVVSEQGDTVAYRGRATRVATRERDVRFWTINPGQTMSSEINLVANYDIQAGTYSVSYSQPFLEMKAWDPDGATYQEARSNVLEIYANSSLIGRERLSFQRPDLTLPLIQTTGPDDTCTSEQAAPINAARNTTSSWSYFARSASNKLFTVKHSVVSGKNVWTPSIAVNSSYATWFGAPENNVQGSSDIPKLEQLWDSGDFLPLHITSAIDARVNLTDHYSCGCSAKAEEDGSAAWTEASGTHVCSIFFRLPFSTYGVDNQVLIILHENAHYADSHGPYIGDQPGGYGRNKAKALALANRNAAIINADNYAYYAEAVRMTMDKKALVSAGASLTPEKLESAAQP